MRPLRALSVALLVLGPAWLNAAARPAAAHAIVVEAQPAAGAEVPGPEIDIRLRFNSRLDHLRSRLSLVRPDTSVELLETAPEEAPEVLAGRAAGLEPGAYRLRWQVLAIDGHITRGDIPFRVVGP